MVYMTGVCLLLMGVTVRNTYRPTTTAAVFEIMSKLTYVKMYSIAIILTCDNYRNAGER
jgi:hypothetical protein